MSYRFAEGIDIPRIVELLKLSLGESLIPKSEAYWRWKHIDNPAGKSPVLLAYDGELLVGVRAFMKWNWSFKGDVIKSVRAVDTATHPKYQGQGIFKKLTLDLIEKCKSNGVSFIFNTPNRLSKPGYLKMGWQSAGRLPVRLIFASPLRRLLQREVAAIPVKEWIKGGFDLKKVVCSNEGLSTLMSKEYINWRYGEVPVAEYVVLDGGDGEIIICRVKKNRWGKEVRITDLLGCRSIVRQTTWDMVRNYAASLGASLISVSGFTSGIDVGFTAKLGPEVTVRDINFSQFDMLPKFAQWRPSTGDLELF